MYIFISKVMRVQKATTLTHGTSLCSIILVLFLEFRPSQVSLNFPFEKTVIHPGNRTSTVTELI